MKSRLVKAGLTLGFVAAFALPSFAQQTSQQNSNATTQSQQEENFGRRGRRHQRHGDDGGRMMMGAMHKLNLTDAQRAQMRAIAERSSGSTKALREELRNLRVQSKQGTLTSEQQARLETLRAELRNTKKSSHAEMLNVLTPEQRTQLEALKAEAKARREASRQQRQGNNQE